MSSRPSSRRRRLAGIGVGLALFLLAELVLRLVGFGAPGHRPDPFAGFAPGEALFVPERAADGGDVLRLRDDRRGPFRPVEFRLPKPADTVRLFCLGGSSTYGFPYGGQETFCAALGRGLAHSRPDVHIEAINLGGMSYGSRRVLNVMREAMAYEPDAFVVYMGHNEYVERRFFAPFLEEAAWRRSLRGALNRLRLYVGLRRLLAPLTRHGADTGDLFGTGPVRDDSRRLARDPREDALVEAQFRFVLEEMKALARSAGTPLLLLTPAANLRDWAPEASGWSSALSQEDRLRRDSALASAERLQRIGDLDSALQAVEEALRLDSSPAAAHFLRGRILLALGDRQARPAFVEARDRDAVPIRITSPLEQALRSARAPGQDGLDMGAALDEASPGGITGDELILDYCHPTPAGHRLIAARSVPSLADALWPGSPPLPFPRPEDLAPAGEEGGGELADSGFGAAWTGQMMLRQGQAAEAEALFRRAIALDPGLATAHEGLGRVLAGQGRTAEAVAALEQAVRLEPDLPNGWNNLGQAYRAAGRLEEALAAYRQALKSGAGAGVVHRNMAATLMQLGRPEPAALEAQAAVAASPGDALAWSQLGAVQAALGDREASQAAYRRALELDPAAPGASEALAGETPSQSR